MLEGADHSLSSEDAAVLSAAAAKFVAYVAARLEAIAASQMDLLD
jgi:hypothetical protein